MDSKQIELAALEAVQKAIEGGFIDIRSTHTESIIECLYILVDQYKEESALLREKLRDAEREIAMLRSQKKNWMIRTNTS